MREFRPEDFYLEPNPARPEWLERAFRKKIANGGRPDFVAAAAAYERLKKSWAQVDSSSMMSDEEFEAELDRLWPRNILRDWPVEIWTEEQVAAHEANIRERDAREGLTWTCEQSAALEARL